MEIWSGNLRLNDGNEIRDIRLNTSSTKPVLPDNCTPQFLSHVDTTRIPLQLIFGPRLDVWTTLPETETWFSNLLFSRPDAATEGLEWWQSASIESPLGILASVQSTETNKLPQPRITEILFYAARKDSEKHAFTPPQDDSAEDPEFGIFALFLSSDLLSQNSVEITPPSSPNAMSEDVVSGHFLPYPWDAPSKQQKRKSLLDSTFHAATEKRKDQKRHLGASVAAAAAKNAVPLPPIPRLQGSNSNASKEKGVLPLLTRPKTRSPSIASLKRETTQQQERRGSGLTKNMVDAEEENTLVKTNKEGISKIVMAGLRVWGFSTSKRKKNKPTTSSTDIQSTHMDSLTEEERKEEEFKALYHHVYKAAVFAFRHGLDKVDLNAVAHADKVRDVVDGLLGVFCRDPLAEGVEDADMGVEGAVVRTPKGEREVALF